jgi:hypothetical protein
MLKRLNLIKDVCASFYMVPSFKDPILKYALPVYGSLLLTMIWRSVARVNGKFNSPRMFAALGMGIRNIKLKFQEDRPPLLVLW